MTDDYTNDPPEEAPDREEQTGTEEETALLPLAIFGSKKVEPGSVCKFKVVRVYEDEAEVAYVPHEDKESTDKDEAPSMREAMGRFDEGMAGEA